MADEPNIQRILEYIRQYGTQYDLDTLRQQLISAGYAAVDVDAAIARYQAEQGGAPAKPPITEATILLPETARPEPAPTPTITIPQSPNLTVSESPAAPPIPPPNREEIIRRILAYLSQHQGSYDTEALRRQVLAAGYPPDLVDEAFRRMPRSSVQAQPGSFRSGFLPGCGIWALDLLVIAGLLFLWNVIDPLGNNIGFLFLLTIVTMLAQGVLGFVLRGRGQAGLGNALIWGTLFTVLIVPMVAVIIGAILFGICIALFGGFSF
jgi:hypothetical protein